MFTGALWKKERHGGKFHENSHKTTYQKESADILFILTAMGIDSWLVKQCVLPICIDIGVGRFIILGGGGGKCSSLKTYRAQLGRLVGGFGGMLPQKNFEF